MRCFRFTPVLLLLTAPLFADPTPAAPAPVPSAPAVAAPHAIAEETPVKLKLLQKLDSHQNRVNDRIRFAVSEDVVGPDRTLLIPKGTPVAGTVTRASHRGMMGKPGKLEFSIDYVQLNADLRVPLRTQKQSLHGRSNAGGSITAALLLLGPGWLLINGREITIPEGKEFTAFVDQKTTVPEVQLAAVPSAPTLKPDPWHLQEIKLKNGNTLTGSILTQKDGNYFIVTELGQFTINRDAIESLTPKAPPKQ